MTDEDPAITAGRDELVSHQFNADLDNPPEGWSERNLHGGINTTRLFVNNTTGAKFIVKIDDYSAAGPDYEMVSNELFRSLGYEGIPQYAINQDNSSVIIVPFVGDGLDLVSFDDNDPSGSSVVTATASGIANLIGNDSHYLANETSLLDMMIFDSMVKNSDRHSGNWMIGRNASGEHYALPIDHGLIYISDQDMNRDIQFDIRSRTMYKNALKRLLGQR